MNAREHLPAEATSRGAGLTGPAALAAERLLALVRAGADMLPLPGRGRTLQRWQRLASVGREDLSLAKLYEGHTDALAILAELGNPAPARNGTWAVWAAEDPQGRTEMLACGGHAVRLNGSKSWCSGAGSVDHALVTAWRQDTSQPQLVAVPMAQPGVAVHRGPWQAIGMAGAPALEVHFNHAHGELVGEPGDYLTRPGFWHGGAGVAACWYGGAEKLAAIALATMARPGRPPSQLQQAAAGRVDLLLRGMQAVLEQGAAWIDAHPADDASAIALRTRLAVDQGATQLLDVVGRALGAAPFCRDGDFARAAADLPVFLRQNHGERDFCALGERMLHAHAEGLAPWAS